MKYSDKQVAAESLNNFVELRESWGEKGLKTRSVHTFEDLKGKFSSITRVNSIVIATFFVETREESESHISEVVSKVKVIY